MLTAEQLRTNYTLVAWLSGGTVKDATYRRYADMFQMSPYEIESCHNWIQSAFPSDEASKYNYDAPIVNRETLEHAHRLREFIEPNMVFMAKIMLKHYSDRYDWRDSNNHNLLRISRIIRSLNLFTGAVRAEWFFHSVRGITLEEGKDWVPEQTLRIWQKHCHPALPHLVT